MSRSSLLAACAGVAALLGACAVAGDPNSHPTSVDASGPHADGPTTVDAFVPTVDAPPADVCASNQICATATVLPGIDGDASGAPATATGYQSAWYQIRVSESDSGPFGTPMTLAVQLTSPASASYDLFVYVNTGTDVLECTTPNGAPSKAGNTESESLAWGEMGTFANGTDDSRTVSIEVRPKSTTCSAAAPWQLTLQGGV